MDITALPPTASLRRSDPVGRWQLLIPSGVVQEGPIHVHPYAGESLSVDVGEGAKVMIVEESGSKLKTQNSKPKGWSFAVDIQLHSTATLTYISLQTLPSDMHCILRHRATIGQEAALSLHIATLGGSTVNHALVSEVRGVGGTSTINWLFFARDHDCQTLSVRNVYAGRKGGGEVTMKGVVQEHAHVVAHGVIEISPGGGGTDTYLTQSVLMLDPTALVDAVPGLEIKTNDVKASHSASITRVSEEDLFYAAARGIPDIEARRMIVEGFLGELIARVPVVELRDGLSRAIEATCAPLLHRSDRSGAGGG